MGQVDLYLWDPSTAKWVKGEVPTHYAYQWQWSDDAGDWVKVKRYCPSTRRTAVGQAVLGECFLHWISMNPSAANSVFEITDASAPGGTVVYDHYHATRDSHHVLIEPAMFFDIGIYLETLTSMTSIIFGFSWP